MKAALAQAGIATAALDARVLLQAALGIDAVELAARPEAGIDAAGMARLRAFLRRRLAREPVGRITGRREFWGLAFALGPDTLEPRPDSETVVETALALLPPSARAGRMLDFGTGSGCLLVALLHELPGMTGLGVDRSPGALAVARANAGRNGLGRRALFAASDWGGALRGPFDLIVANPPYIPTNAIAGLAPEVALFDPLAALDGGTDGLDAYREVLAASRALLRAGGLCVVEIGMGQAQDVTTIGTAAGLVRLRVAEDLSGHARAVAFAAPASYMQDQA
jgi:release factor glutamine methyltransferase